MNGTWQSIELWKLRPRQQGCVARISNGGHWGGGTGRAPKARESMRRGVRGVWRGVYPLPIHWGWGLGRGGARILEVVGPTAGPKVA